MTRGQTSRRLPRLRAGAAIWWDAVSGGRFFTWWSALAAIPVGVIVLAPYASAVTAADVIVAQVSALGVVLVLSAALVPVAWLERRLSSPLARGVLVLGSLVVAAAARPFLNEALVVDVFGLARDPAWPERVSTNIVAWISVLSLVAVTEQLYASSRRAMGRLIEALRTVSDEQRRAGRFERESRLFLAAEIGAIREALSALLLSRLDFDRVSVFSDRVRAASHRARARSDLSLADIAPDAAPSPPGVPARVFLARLRPSPVGLVGTIFALGSASFALRAGGPPLVLLVVAGMCSVGLLADRAIRRISRRQTPAGRGATVLMVWSSAGVLVAAVGASILGARGVVPLLPVVALPGIAVIAAVCADAVHRGRVEARRLGRALQVVVRTAADRSAATRLSLVHASEVLHGPVQGTCVVLAARVDDDLATAADIAAFEIAVGAALDDALDERAPDNAAGLDETVAIWQPVMTVSSHVDADAQAAMSDPLVSLRVVAIVAEGLVNAVKHAARRSATIEVSGGALDGSLRVRVSSPGQLHVDPARAGLGVSALGPTARVFQHGHDVVLEASVPARPVPGAARAQAMDPAGQRAGVLHDSDSM